MRSKHHLRAVANPSPSRRRFFQRLGTAGVVSLAGIHPLIWGAIVRTDTTKLTPYGNATLLPGVRSRTIDDINGLTMHMLEAGFESPGRPLVILLHGFPELAYSWRKVMRPLAEAGYHVVAPDRRGYGRHGWLNTPARCRVLHLLDAHTFAGAPWLGKPGRSGELGICEIEWHAPEHARVILQESMRIAAYETTVRF